MIPIRNQNLNYYFVNVIAFILTASVCLSLNSRGGKNLHWKIGNVVFGRRQNCHISFYLQPSGLAYMLGLASFVF